jgi:hypothetical protein
MLVNQMQRDLQSANVLECCGGLLAATSLITGDMVPAVSTEVIKLLSHDSPTVRKKAIVALHRFHQLAPEVATKEELQTQLRKVLCDKDPSVMGSSLNVIQWMARIDPLPFKELVPSLVSILKQIGDHRLPSDYDYHRVPAPWMQRGHVPRAARHDEGGRQRHQRGVRHLVRVHQDHRVHLPQPRPPRPGRRLHQPGECDGDARGRRREGARRTPLVCFVASLDWFLFRFGSPLAAGSPLTAPRVFFFHLSRSSSKAARTTSSTSPLPASP